MQLVENRFRVLKDFLGLRPIFHWTETRVRGHIAVCVLAAVIETLLGNALREHDVRDPDIHAQHLTAPRALDELDRIRRVTLTAGENHHRGGHPPHPPPTADPRRARRRHRRLDQTHHPLTGDTHNILWV
jgi:hypothetical protein